MRRLNTISYAAVFTSFMFSEPGLLLAASAKPKQYIVIIDVSASRTPEMIEDARRFLGQIVDRLNFGEQLVLLQTQQDGLRDHPLRWRVSLPSLVDPTFIFSRDKEHLIGEKKGIRSVLPTFFEPSRSGKILHTDLFATLLVAGEYSRDSAGRATVLVLLSDMLQSSARGIEMEHLARMPTRDWIEKQKHAGLIPHLPGVCVMAIGPDVTSSEGAKIRSFWLEYFRAVGASLLPGNYRSTAPSLEAGVCGGGE